MERCVTRQNRTILELRKNRVWKRENRVLSFEKTSIFLYLPLEKVTRNDLFLEKHINNYKLAKVNSILKPPMSHVI